MHASNGASNLLDTHRTRETCPERPPLRFPIGTPVTQARAVLAEAGEAMALVTNRGADVGVVTAEDLGRDVVGPAASIRDVMRREIVCIDPSTDLRWTLLAYRECAWSSAIRRRPGQWTPPTRTLRVARGEVDR